MYKMTPNPKNPKQADRNGRKANPKTLTSMNRMRMANHLGSPKHREQVNMFRSNPAESGGAKGGNNNVEFGAGRSETRYKEQSGYHKSEKKKKLKGKIHDAGSFLELWRVIKGYSVGFRIFKLLKIFIIIFIIFRYYDIQISEIWGFQSAM